MWYISREFIRAADNAQISMAIILVEINNARN